MPGGIRAKSAPAISGLPKNNSRSISGAWLVVLFEACCANAENV